MSAKKSSFFSLSTLASVLTAFYLVSAIYNFSRIMYPLSAIDLSAFGEEDFVHPLWKNGGKMYMRVYLSTQNRFTYDFLKAGFEQDEDDTNEQQQSSVEDVAFLWDEVVDSPSFSKSFLLTTKDCTGSDSCEDDESYMFATKWLDEAEQRSIEREGGILSVVSSAGQGIESTSILLTFYQSIAKQVQKLLVALSLASPPEEKDDVYLGLLERQVIHLSPTSPIWSSLRSNSTLFAHVLVIRADAIESTEWPPVDVHALHNAIRQSSQTRSLLQDRVNLVKFDAPHHVSKPSRILYPDVLYLWNKYILGKPGEHAPWDMEFSKPTEFEAYQRALRMKKEGTGYPYWKPEVAIKYVNDDQKYPLDYVHLSGMPLVQLRKSKEHPTGYSFTAGIHVDEIGLTSEKYIPVNETLTSLPLRISFHRSDMEQHTSATTANAGGISPARWRLLSQLSASLESQKQLGFDQSDIDDVRRLIADTNVTLLAITVLASALHLLFEFLTFKNEVSFWNKNKDLTGLSVRSLFLDAMGQSVILIYLIERESSLLITVPSGIGCLISFWKCQRASGLKLVRLQEGINRPITLWNFLPRLFGYELKATRLEIETKSNNDGQGEAQARADRLTVLTIESDRQATRTLGVVLLPLVLGYTLYSFIWQEHTSWFSWLISSASSAVYALGFVLMTPQLFLNYKMKSVAHLPWRVLVYKSLNTFIDDLFSFIIRMPTMARISCFRDDVVFFIYLYQRWLYPVDTSRPVEGGGEMEGERSSSLEKKNQ